MPQTAQTFIKTHFPDNKVAMAKMETDWFDKSYDVIFTNGDKLEFDKKGIWTEVNCKYSAVPVAVVPEANMKGDSEKNLKFKKKHDFFSLIMSGCVKCKTMLPALIFIAKPESLHFTYRICYCQT